MPCQRLAGAPCSGVPCAPVSWISPPMPSSHRLIRFVRSCHLYLGVFTAPMLLFLAVSGGLQTFGLHEASRGSSYAPPAWLASMAQLPDAVEVITVDDDRAPAGASFLAMPTAAPALANAVFRASAIPARYVSW